ncbi:uncharacterized protein [Triticum aestivum]|uniref:uncharacterized protein n=1 Tax=Triticum aestivum TaxID=4565 RepID=UPI001D0076CA|nr:uncharacterized protein LOC123170109 [Triticum aestivum]
MAAAAEEPCCISHAFDRAARRDPARLAVVHAGDGGAASPAATSHPPSPRSPAASPPCFLALPPTTPATTGPQAARINRGEAQARCLGSLGCTPRRRWRCGEAFLPLDPSWPEDRVRSAVSASNAVLVVSAGVSNEDDVLKGSSCPVLRFNGDIRCRQGSDDVL